MSVTLLRIDDRLVHGQVVEGWLKSLRITHLVVASDLVAADETQKALYLLAVPQGIQLSCLTLADAAQAWKDGRWSRDRVLMLASSPEEALELVNAGAPVESINVGGLHFREGRVQVLKAISLDDRDVDSLKALSSRGVILEARPLPLDEPVNLAPYIDRWKEEREQPR